MSADSHTPRNPFLMGERVYLRAIEEADAEQCYTWFSDPEVRRTIGRAAYPNTLRESLEFIRGADGRTRQMFAIVVKADGDYIGNCDLFAIDLVHRHAELGIVIGRKEHWGKKFGREAVRLLCTHAFGSLNLHRVTLRVFAHNARGLRAYSAVGFKLEGRVREDVFIEGRYYDTLIMGLLRGELEPVDLPEREVDRPPGACANL